MWVLWSICVLLLIIAVVLLIKPLFKTYSDDELAQNQKQANRRKELNIELYEQKKAQIEVDCANGLLDEESKIQAQNEIEHSLIQDAEVSTSSELVQLSGSHAKKLAAAFLVFITVFSVIVYAVIMPQNIEQIVLNKQPAMSPNMGQQAPDISSMVVSLENKLKADPNNIQGWNMLGRSYVVLQQFADAVGAYEKALELSKSPQPDNSPQEEIPDLEINYVEALMQTGDKQNYQKARTQLQVLLNANPDNGDALWFMGFLDYESDNLPLAVQHWTHLLALLPANSEQAQIVNTYLSRVRAELPDGHPAKIAEQAPIIPQNNAPKGPAPGQQMTGSSEEQAFIAAMIARVENRVKENPQDLKGWKALGKSYTVLKRYTDSANAYAKAVALDNNDVELMMNYTDAVIMTEQVNQLDNARIVFAQMLDKNPENADVLFLSGSLARAAGDVNEARMFWSKLLPLLAKGSEAYISVETQLNSL